jgi:hypothetical protein
VNTTVIVGIIAGILVLATAATTGTLNLAIVSAEKCDNGTPCDGWGQSTKKATEEEGGDAVGEHSSNPDPSDDDHDTPREGLGNFADRLTGNKNPSDLGDIVDGDIP